MDYPPRHKAPRYPDIRRRWFKKLSHEDSFRHARRIALPGQEHKQRKKWKYEFDPSTLSGAISDAREDRTRLLRELQTACEACKREGLPHRSAQRSLYSFWDKAKLEKIIGLSPGEAKAVLMDIVAGSDKISMITRSLQESLAWRAQGGYT